MLSITVAILFIALYTVVAVTSAITFAHAPAIEETRSRFDLRIGNLLVEVKACSAVEAYFPIDAAYHHYFSSDEMLDNLRVQIECAKSRSAHSVIRGV